uniref:RRM domain-containing protein n=1 Tax=Junco hyemalis TaxID=40217 RepID=A0A8C5IT59_JUNHY
NSFQCPQAPNRPTQRSSATEGSAYSATVSQGYVLPEGKVMPNTVFVGGIDIRMNEAEIRSVFEQYGTVKEVKVITDRTGVSKGYGFVSFLDNVDVQKIVESQINFHGKKLKLGPAIRKQQNFNSCVQPRQIVLGPPPPQFQSVWGNQSMETYVQPPAVMNPVTSYVQVGLLLTLAQPQWLAGEPRNYTSEVVFVISTLFLQLDTSQKSLLSGSKSVDRGMQTVLSCLSSPENQLTNDFVSQDSNAKGKTYHFRKGKAVHKAI